MGGRSGGADPLATRHRVALQLVLKCILPHELGGSNAACVFVDCDFKFVAARLLAVLVRHVTQLVRPRPPACRKWRAIRTGSPLRGVCGVSRDCSRAATGCRSGGTRCDARRRAARCACAAEFGARARREAARRHSVRRRAAGQQTCPQKVERSPFAFFYTVTVDFFKI